jgi:predicted dehydrogenase
LDQLAGLAPIESNGVDGLLHGLRPGFRQRGQVRRELEQALRGRRGHAILRAQTEDAAGENPVRLARGRGKECRDRGFRAIGQLSKAVDRRRDASIVDPASHELRHVVPHARLLNTPALEPAVDRSAATLYIDRAMRLRVGIIGVGKHGRRYAKHVRDDVPELELVAVCRRDPERGRTDAREFGCEYVADPVTLARRKDVDVLVLAAAPDVIGRVVPVAAASDKRLVVEKPVAFDLAAGRELLSILQSHATYCMAAQTLRMNAVVGELRSRVSELGRLDSLIFSQRFPPQLDLAWLDDPSSSGGGNVLHTGVHCFDLCRVLARSEPVTAYCTGGSVYTQRTEDVFTCSIKMANGVLASVSCSRTTQSRNGLIEVSGERGQLVADHVLHSLYRIDSKGRENLALPPPTQTVLELLRVLVEDCRHDRAPTIDYHAGLAAVAVADACYRSIKSGRAEDVVMP